VTAVEGVPRKKFDPQDTIEGTGEDIIVWTGPADDTMVLGMRLVSKVGARNIDLTANPQVKFEGDKRPNRFSKRELVALKNNANNALSGLSSQLKALGNGKDAGVEQQRSLLNQQIEQLTKGGGQIDAVLEFLDAVKGQVKVQCRVYHLAEDTQVDLLVTSNDAPAEK
jgi:hypothetical protein